jgi:hypothetical protein
MIKDWLRVFRAQTAPLSVIIVLAAYLNGDWNLTTALVLIILMVLSHWFMYGHNSLMDTVMGYDFEDPGKEHHPLIDGRINWNTGHRVIHTGLVLLAIITIIVTISIAVEPILALICLILWIVLGQAYNDGMSKESLLGPVMIAGMTSAMVGWAWFLSHETFGNTGTLYLIYIFLLIYFQIAIDGSLKDIKQPEKSNILIKMGVHFKHVHTSDTEAKTHLFFPVQVTLFSIIISFCTMMIALWLYVESTHSPWIAIFLGIIMAGILVIRHQLTYTPEYCQPEYSRERDLKYMSIEQILCIYLPIPLLIPVIPAFILMIAGVIYFFGMNKFLWGSVTHPRV